MHPWSALSGYFHAICFEPDTKLCMHAINQRRHDQGALLDSCGQVYLSCCGIFGAWMQAEVEPERQSPRPCHHTTVKGAGKP